MILSAFSPGSRTSSRDAPNFGNRQRTRASASSPSNPRPPCTGRPCGELSRRRRRWPPSGHRASAMRTIKGEPAAGWMVFETNQGTDDHVIPGQAVEPKTTVQVEREVSGRPRSIRGGHVVVELNDLEAAAYEPSKGFRTVVRALRPGDRVRVVGSIRDQPRTLNIEKLQVLSLSEESHKLANPLCFKCQKRAKSMGRKAGFRCARCGQRFPASSPITAHVG